jgi:alkylresorcinol/alkylpyrone synthase
MSSFYRGTEDLMGWDTSEEGLRIVPSAEVPDMVRKHFAQDVDCFLADNDLGREDIST